ncbi:MAG: zf-HC2 domain-containing protein, partial [Acidobacteriota bacterium]
MSKNQRSHPDPDRLMLFCDGELNPSESAEIRRHLDACWDCRAEMERIQKTISECVEYRRTVLQ